MFAIFNAFLIDTSDVNWGCDYHVLAVGFHEEYLLTCLACP